jgi:hypothetical protein
VDVEIARAVLDLRGPDNLKDAVFDVLCEALDEKNFIKLCARKDFVLLVIERSTAEFTLQDLIDGALKRTGFDKDLTTDQEIIAAIASKKEELSHDRAQEEPQPTPEPLAEHPLAEASKAEVTADAAVAAADVAPVPMSRTTTTTTTTASDGTTTTTTVTATAGK